MSFYVACQCGRAFEVEVEGGHSDPPTARCPDCGRDVPVATPEDPSTPEPVETVDAELAGDEPAPIGPESAGPAPEYGPPPGFGPEINFGGPRQIDLQSSGTGCLLLLAAVAVAALAFPQFGAVVAISAGSCCVVPALIIGGTLWWRIRKFKQMTDPNRRRPPGSP